MGAATSKKRETKLTFNMNDLDGMTNRDVKISNQYRVKSPPLGRSSFGELREALHTTLHQRRLIKILYKSQFTPEDLEDIRREMNLTRSLDHPLILKVLEFVEDEKYFYVIMDYFKGRELLDRVREGPFEEAVAAKILKSLVEVMQYLHNNKIVHRDLTLENIMYNGSSIKIIDFAFAEKLTKKKKYLNDIVGTPYYIAPEVLAGSYAYSCDIWSFGVIMFFMLEGEPPFRGNFDNQIFENISKGVVEFKTVSNPQTIQLIRDILQKNPGSRPTWAEIAEHPFFKVSVDLDMRKMKANFNILLRNMRSFTFEHKFQLAMYLCFVYQIGNDLSLRETIDSVYRAITRISSNSFSKSDLRSFIDRYKIDMKQKEIDILFDTIDLDKTDTIDYYEFVASATDRSKLLTDENIEKIFNFLDIEHKHYLEKKDLIPLFGKNIKEKEVDDFLSLYDRSHSNQLNLDSFRALIKKLVT